MLSPNSPEGLWFSTILLDYSPASTLFWERDAGLFYRGLKAHGKDARLVAIGDPSKTQAADLVLAPLSDLQKPDWWKQWKLEGIILYSWALPRFTGVAAAAKASGARLVLIIDTAGYISPRVWPWMYFRLKSITEKQRSRFFPSLRALIKTGVASLKARHRGFIRHLEYADFLVFPSTLGKQRYNRHLLSLGRPDIAAKSRVVPHPVSDRMVYDPSINKEKVIVSVGGWHRLQKNTPTLIGALGRVLDCAPDYSAHVIGQGTDEVRRLASRLPERIRTRIRMTPPVPNDELPRHYQSSRISFCSSHYESFHIATGEALCCGCSFVGDARISPMVYFASLGAGTLACDGAVRNFSDALLAEIDLWDRGLRDPAKISRTWTGLLHPAMAAGEVLGLR